MMRANRTALIGAVLVSLFSTSIVYGSETMIDDTLTEAVLPTEPDTEPIAAPAPMSPGSGEIVERWLRSTQAPPPTLETSGSRTSIYVLLVSIWLIILVACFAWWKRNVQAR